MPMNCKYKTKQKETILSYFTSNRKTHVTADDIIFNLKIQNTPVSKSTVYRNLDALVNEGIIRKYFIDENTSACYEYIEHSKCKDNNHYHLRCTVCNELFHIESSMLDSALKDLLNKSNFNIDNTKTVFYGTCNSCFKKSQKEF